MLAFPEAARDIYMLLCLLELAGKQQSLQSAAIRKDPAWQSNFMRECRTTYAVLLNPVCYLILDRAGQDANSRTKQGQANDGDGVAAEVACVRREQRRGRASNGGDSRLRL